VAENGPKKESDEARPPFRETILRVVSACLIGAIVAIVIPNIFGEEFATRKVARVVAPFVGAFYKRDERNGITVLLVDDRALDEAGETWPPSYDFYAKILNDVAQYAPKAVFVDLIFSSVRQDVSVKGLHKVLEKMQKDHIKVFLAAPPNDKGELSLRPGLEGLGTKVAVEYDPDSLDHVVWTYPMQVPNVVDGQAGEKTHEKTNGQADLREAEPKPARSAALAIYEYVHGTRIEEPTEPLALTWGLFPVQDGLEWTVLNDNGKREAALKDHDPAANVFKEDYDLYCNESQHMLTLVFSAVSHALVAEHGRPVCVFHHTLYQREMLYPNQSQTARLRELLENKIVMIGSAFSYSNDLVFSPIQERVPGVYLHAMALDNLLTSGSDYTKAIELHKLEADGPHARALLLLLIGGIFVMLLSLVKERVIEPLKKKFGDARRPPGRIEIDETIVSTTREADSGDAESEQSVTVSLHAEVVNQPHRRPRNWWLAKLIEGGFLTLLKLGEVLLSLVMVCVLLLLGHWVLKVPYLAIVHVTLFALVAEWFEWNKKLIDWYLGQEEKS
jgi:hypothetical protein